MIIYKSFLKFKHPYFTNFVKENDLWKDDHPRFYNEFLKTSSLQPFSVKQHFKQLPHRDSIICIHTRLLSYQTEGTQV